MASWSAYITIYGVMIPVLSAGSNQDGVSATCTANVNWPGVLAWAGKVEAARPMAVRASTSRLDSSRSLPPRPEEAVIVFSLKEVEYGTRIRLLTPQRGDAVSRAQETIARSGSESPALAIPCSE